MASETKTCQNCKNSFVIEDEDFKFYKKINVPAPTWCPDCRQQRRYAWRNERVLYRRECDLCKKSTVTIYSPNKPYKVYCPDCWWGDGWDAAEFGRDFDFSRPFFEQFQELQFKVPRIALLTKNSVNSEYTNHSTDNRDCYLSISVFKSWNILYSTNIWDGSQDCVDCYRAEGKNELLYECIDVIRCYKCQYGILLRDCNNCQYSYDCRGCTDCFLCVNLRNKQYHILNQPYSKEEYLKKLQEYTLGSYDKRQELYSQFLSLVRDTAMHRFAVIERSTNTTGDMVINAKNSTSIFDGTDVEDSKYAIICPTVKDVLDLYHCGLPCELCYEVHAMVRCYDTHFTHLSYDNTHLMYCDSCHNTENLFGCVGLRKKQYHIFNKPYSPEEYAALKEKIIEHMKKTGEFGEFFPVERSPFGYNETQGQVYMPLSKEEVQKRNWKWEDRVPGTFGKETLKAEQVPDTIADVQDSMLNEILVCTECKKNFKLIKPELAFYRQENIPVPRLCPDCRYRRKIVLRNPRKLWHRQCMCDYKVYKNSSQHSHHLEGRCPNEFETSYSPDRKEIVYCESCYNSEVV